LSLSDCKIPQAPQVHRDLQYWHVTGSWKCHKIQGHQWGCTLEE
jgi:hypothetical protein